MVHRPNWFQGERIFVSYARTVGINKDGDTLFTVDHETGKRSSVVDNRVAGDVSALLDEDETTPTSRWINRNDFGHAVPYYYDDRQSAALDEMLATPGFEHFESRSLGGLVEQGLVERRHGHGSPSQDLRGGTVPYIKVSDIRAGQVNINPTNLVSDQVAQRFWRSNDSGVRPFDLVTPIRASSNIGEFAIIMPGQERMVLTKEVLILRATDTAPVDNFYLLWALTLKVVRAQWKRIVFMQTNREDVGNRYLELEIPWPKDGNIGATASADFRNYYTGLDRLRKNFVSALEQSDLHHVFFGEAGSEPG